MSCHYFALKIGAPNMLAVLLEERKIHTKLVWIPFQYSLFNMASETVPTRRNNRIRIKINHTTCRDGHKAPVRESYNKELLAMYCKPLSPFYQDPKAPQQFFYRSKEFFYHLPNTSPVQILYQ